ncbi:unnamed protein product [marine sediment metagenome]|uniref:Uncharacterized protein n=1 Tax=marine sediment metagenome TaxID=412755 RepID=X1DUM7_9ZZZZ
MKINQKKLTKIAATQTKAIRQLCLHKIDEAEFKAITRELNVQRKRMGIIEKPICGFEGMEEIKMDDNTSLLAFKGVYKRLRRE